MAKRFEILVYYSDSLVVTDSVSLILCVTGSCVAKLLYMHWRIQGGGGTSVLSFCFILISFHIDNLGYSECGTDYTYAY